MYLLKLANRNLKVLLSVGGYTYSQDGHFAFVTNPSLRAAFVRSSTSYIENFGLDGIDIDFEYANTPALAAGFADLLTEMRTAFDALAQKKSDSTTYQLTVRTNKPLSPLSILIVIVPRSLHPLATTITSTSMSGRWTRHSPTGT